MAEKMTAKDMQKRLELWRKCRQIADYMNSKSPK